MLFNYEIIVFWISTTAPLSPSPVHWALGSKSENPRRGRTKVTCGAQLWVQLMRNYTHNSARDTAHNSESYKVNIST